MDPATATNARAMVDSLAGRPEALDSMLRDLTTRAAAGNRDAVETLLYAIDSQRLAEPGVRQVLFEPHDVDEAAQDVLIAVAEHVGSYRGDSRFTTWLFGLARHKALDVVRRKRDNAEFRIELGDSERISSLIASELSIQELLAELPDRYRAAVTLRDVDGLSYTEVADRLGLNLNTTRTRIVRGRALLAALVGEKRTR